MTPIPASKLATRPGLRVGEVHGVAGDGDGPDLVDVAAATDAGQPAVAVWAGDGREPAVLPLAAVPDLIAALTRAALDAVSPS